MDEIVKKMGISSEGLRMELVNPWRSELSELNARKADIGELSLLKSESDGKVDAVSISSMI